MAFDQTQFDIFQRSIIDPLEDLDQDIQRLATQIVDEMRAMAPNDTGALKKSIKLTMDRYGFEINMLGYGAYQNFGVAGRENTSVTSKTDQPFSIGDFAVPVGTEFQFGAESISSDSGLSFGARRNIATFGINRQRFFNLSDIQNRLKVLIENQIEN